MLEKDFKIDKYPYLGYSENLIECFSIVGYEENNLPEIIQEYRKNNNNLFRPVILSSIISNKDFGIIDNDLIISQIFPMNPKFINISNIQTTGKNIGSPAMPKTKNIIYSFMVDSSDGKKKLFYTCFGYIFYEKYSYDSNNNLFSLEEYYIPKAFCIISQYSFFSFFLYICENLYNLLNSQANKIPMEIIVYNFVNFLPSPLNYKINYNIFSFELNIPSYNIPQISGYPYLDFDLTEIFSILPLNLVLEIFLLTFIEQSILFFSSDLEILNIVMFIMYTLNYPCNNSTYFWHIVSIDKNSINEENRFVSQIMTSLLGINSSYDESINTFPFGDYHFIVDIDNKKIIFKENNMLDLALKKDIEKISRLKFYFQNIIKEKNVESLYLKNYIEILKKSIENILTKEELNAKNKKEIKINFFTGEKENNKLIQEAFYNFILNILIIFYEDINLHVTYDKIKFEQLKNKNQNEQEPNLTEEEIFFELFKSTSKYKIYFENFIQNSESHDLFKIPLILSEEFINLKNRIRKNQLQLKISFFNIIDEFYISSGNSLNISLNNFYYQYNEANLKAYFNEHDIQMKENNSNDSKLFNFRKSVLHKYVFILNNKYVQEKLKILFPSLKIKKESIYQIDRKTIPLIILNFLDKNNLIKTSNYLIYSLIYVFSILMSLYSFKNLLYYMDKIFEPIKQIEFFLRFYCFIIIQTFSKYYLINKETGKYPEMKYTNIKIYFYLFLSHLKEENILPNKELFIIQKQIFGKNIFRERASFKEKNFNLEMEIVDSKQQDIEFDLKDKNIFQIFMKYNFGYKGYYKPNKIIKTAIKEQGNYNIAFKDETLKNSNTDKKRKNPIIVTKVKDDVYTSELYAPKKIFKLSQALYKDFINNSKLDLENVNIKLLRDILVNLIQYSIELKELNIPYEFLVNGLFLTRNISDKLRMSSIKSIYNNNTNNNKV